MHKIFISDSGDDANTGEKDTPIYSWNRFLQLKNGKEAIVILGDVEATIARLTAEIEARRGKLTSL
jgi:hypothetical protein